nr:MAG TPA: helix-turn-helix domain protein [Caudoviricetes sp.]
MESLRNTELITVEQASQLLGIPVSTMRKMCARGEVYAKKAGKRWLINRRILLSLYGLQSKE